MSQNELDALKKRIRELEEELVKESGRTASEKTRADQMSLQHRMQADLHSEARQAVSRLSDELREEVESCNAWRRLAHQFDGHRMQAMGFLKFLVKNKDNEDKVQAMLADASEFIKLGPVCGDEVYEQRKQDAESYRFIIDNNMIVTGWPVGLGWMGSPYGKNIEESMAKAKKAMEQ